MNNRIHIEPEIVRQVIGGDSKAFGDLVNRLMKPAYFHALALLGDHDEAADISQETFIRAWKARKKIDVTRPFYPWFYTILKRLCLNRARDNKRRQQTPVSSLPGWIEPAADVDSPGDGLIRQEEHRMLERALSELDMKDREIIVMKDLQGLAYKEIAELLDIPVGTVMSRLYTARKRLKQQMEEAGYEHS